MRVEGESVMKKVFDGYSLPLTPKNESSLINELPWYFGGDVIEILYHCDYSIFREYLPECFSVTEYGPLVSVSIIDMTSITKKDIEINNVVQTGYRECIIKFCCSFNNKTIWFPIITYVDKDFSLVRGYIQGFSKKEANISFTKFHCLNELLNKISAGTNIKGVCNNYDINIYLSLELIKQISETELKSFPICTNRYIPDISNKKEYLVNDLVEIKMDNIKKENIWECEGNVIIEGKSEFAKFQPTKIIKSFRYSQGFKIIGGDILDE